MEAKRIQLKIIIIWLVALFLILTGIGTATAFTPDFAEEGSDLRLFVEALIASGYIITWIGIFKFFTGVLLIIPKTRALAILMLLPYTINILLYTFFIGQMFIPVSLILLFLNVYLIYSHWDSFKGIIIPKL